MTTTAADPPPLSASLRAWLLTWLAYATYYTGRKGFSVVKRALESDLGIGREALGTIDTAYLVAYAGGQFASGLIGDKIGARRLIGYGMLLSAMACAAFGAATEAMVFAILFFVNGAAQSTGWPGTTRAVAEWTTPTNRGTVMAFWATCYQVGGIVATAMAAWLLVHYGWRAAFYVPAVTLAAVSLLIFAFLRPGPRQVQGRDATSRGVDATLRLAARRAVMRSPLIWSYGASYFCIKLIRYSLLFWLPYYLADGVGYDDDVAGYLSTAFEVGGVVGVIGIGTLSDRVRHVGRAGLAAISLLGLGAALLVCDAAAHAGLGATIAAFSLVGALLFGPDSLISGAAAQDAGGLYATSTATGFVNGMGSIGAILQGAITVWVSRAWGWTALFHVFVGLALLSALCLVPSLRMDPKLRRSLD
jgi:MFS transporter, OPA family, sugar phosphate sensor protein UhpC